MKKASQIIFFFSLIAGSVSLFISCDGRQKSITVGGNLITEYSSEINPVKEAQPLSEEFKAYWYSGEAEITSYELKQARYGELRQGKAVLIFVTEDFLPTIQVKADQVNPSNISVLKLNATKNFNTGIYPYSVMQSTFYPVSNNQHALKVTCSMQEWCGHVYVQLNNREKFEVNSHSYFQDEADKVYNLNKSILENELWTQLRLDPKQLPTGELNIIPSLEYLRFSHNSLKAYKAKAELRHNNYKISYPELNRTLTINFNSTFPYDILGWEETFKSGFDPDAILLTTTATKLAFIRSPYWGKNKNEDEVLRDSLLLK